MNGCDSLTINYVKSTIVDLVDRLIEISLSNVSLRAHIKVEDRSFYGLHPDDPRYRTVFLQEMRK
ncbi:hypothetical protein QJS10_CPA02g00928 [Acorus calamus]|uniref:PRELI/MSF1 domain-containing protein n=1 Tax=Acorus calamus TaxID=4465 RepID=A0AAV9FDD1_ACOCL|nr:hypothetical protein QJS10_CPA02g00928 [Acorus calamus]